MEAINAGAKLVAEALDLLKSNITHVMDAEDRLFVDKLVNLLQQALEVLTTTE